MSAKQSQMRHPLGKRSANRFLRNYCQGGRLTVAGPQTLRLEKTSLVTINGHKRYQIRDGDTVVWAGYHDKAQNCLAGPALPEQLPPGRVPNQSDRAALHNAVTDYERDIVCALLSWMREAPIKSDHSQYLPDEWPTVYAALLAEKGSDVVRDMLERIVEMEAQMAKLEENS